jgi:hypothetical protein
VEHVTLTEGMLSDTSGDGALEGGLCDTLMGVLEGDSISLVWGLDFTRDDEQEQRRPGCLDTISHSPKALFLERRALLIELPGAVV